MNHFYFKKEGNLVDFRISIFVVKLARFFIFTLKFEIYPFVYSQVSLSSEFFEYSESYYFLAVFPSYCHLIIECQ